MRKSRYERYLRKTTQTKTTVYVRWRNKVRKMTRHLTFEHKQETSKGVKTQPKIFWNYVNEKIKSTEAIPALKIADETYAMTDNKSEFLNNFFSSVFTHETPGKWDVVKQHVNKISDDLRFNTELVLKEITEINTTKSMGPDNLLPRILYGTRNVIASKLSSIFQTSWDLGEIPRHRK